MHNHFVNGVLSLIVLLFAIFRWSNEVVIIGAALILIYSVVDCNNHCRPNKGKMSPMKPKKKK